MTKINKIPRNTLVLIVANTSSAFESFRAKICVIATTADTNRANNSREKIPAADVIIKNQSDNPNVTANALNLGDENSI